MNSRAHWERARGTDKQAADYCRKDDTHPEGSLRFELGELKGEGKRRSRDALEEAVIEEVEDLKNGFKAAGEIDAQVLARPGFIAAYNILTADLLGPYRPNLKIITMVAPPGTGKSFAINTLFPKAGRAIMGNGGTWFLNLAAGSWCSRSLQGKSSCRRCSSTLILIQWHWRSRVA